MSAAVVLRHDVQPGDLGQIIQLHGTIYAREHGLGSAFEAEVAVRLAEFVQSPGEGGRLWIAERAGRLVGCIAVVGLSPKDAQLRWFVVDPLARGLGLGEHLLGEAVAFCEERGYEYLFLWTIRPSKSALEMYRGAGFERVGGGCSERWGVEVIEETYALFLGSRS